MKKTYLFPILTLFLISLSSCKTEVTSEDVKDDLKKNKRKSKIEKIKFYQKNPSITDENGISYSLKVKIEELSKVKEYQSEKIYFEDSEYITVGSYEVIQNYKLIKNGDLMDEIQLFGYSLESRRSDENGYGNWCSDTYTFAPELESVEWKKKLIAEFTGGNCGMGEVINSQVKKERISAVKASGLIGEIKIPSTEKVSSGNVNKVGNPEVKNRTKESINVEEVNKTKESLEEQKDDTKFKITVDNLRVRTTPDLGAEKIESLSLNTEVEFLNEKSKNWAVVRIKGSAVREHWYKIKTPSGNIGWIHGCCFNK